MRTNEKTDDPNTIFDATSLGLVNQLEQWLYKEASLVNTKHHTGKSLLHLAVENGQVDCVRMLVKWGAQVNAVDLHGQTPLHAMMNRCTLPKIVDILIEHGADINHLDANGNSPLTLCAGTIHRSTFAWGNYQNLTEVLIKYGALMDIHCASMLNKPDSISRILKAAPHQINSQQKEGCLPEGKTPLHHACERGNFDAAKELLRRGADLELTDSRGRTPFYLAGHESGTRRLHSDPRVLELLLSETKKTCIIYTLLGAVNDLSKVISADRSLLSTIDPGGNSLLHLAAWNGKQDVADFLISQGLDVNAMNMRGEKPIDLAAIYQNYALAELLLEHGAEVDIFTAVKLGKLLSMKESRLKKQINTTNRYGRTPLRTALELAINNTEGLYWCGKMGDWTIVRQLIDYGAQIDIWTASSLGLMDVVTSLINQGKGKVNAIDNFFTPLHCAVQNNQIETAHYLISQGGALEARTISGYSPLRLACGIIQGKLKSKEMVNMLLTFGADQFSMDNWGNTPSDLMMWHEKRRSSSQ